MAFFVTLVFVTIFVSPAILFYPMGALLYRNDHPAKHADAVLVLMGEVQIRPRAASTAVSDGFSNKIIFVTSEMSPLEESGLKPSEESLTLSVLEREGISSNSITVIRDFGRATSTADEALAVARFLGPPTGTTRRLVVVTSWPHSARAGWILDKALDQNDVRVELLPIERIPYDKSDWWQSERGLLFVFEEYIKWARYLIKYLGRDLA